MYFEIDNRPNIVKKPLHIMHIGGKSIIPIDGYIFGFQCVVVEPTFWQKGKVFKNVSNDRIGEYLYFYFIILQPKFYLCGNILLIKYIGKY